jgi:RNA polymerase sigma-70 factor (ECF subfamily)
MSNHFADIDSLLCCHHTDDPAIIESIIDCYYAIVYRVAVSILRDPDEAKDATQDTFMLVMENLHRYTIGTHFKAWLYTITVNTCRGYLRKRKVRDNLVRLMQPVQALMARPPNPEAAALRNETRSHLWDAVDRLGEKHRITIILRMAHGLSVREIAQVLGIREKTVYSRLYEGFRKLRYDVKGQIELESIADYQPIVD